MQLSSSAFAASGDIPSRYTCEGDDEAPPLAWADLPAGTQSLALIVDDPDAPDPAAPQRTWVHWVVYNLPPEPPTLDSASALPAGACEGINDWQRSGYGGPCPPVGRHRYVHTLYALDTALPTLHPATKASLKEAMHGHVLGQAELIGHYRKQR